MRAWHFVKEMHLMNLLKYCTSRIYAHRFVRRSYKSHLSRVAFPQFRNLVFALFHHSHFNISSFLSISKMVSSSMNLFLTIITLFFICNIVDAAVNCTTQNLLWNQSLPVDARSVGYGTVALSPDSLTVFANAYSSSNDGPSYLVGTATNGSGNALVYSTQDADYVLSSPVFVNSTTIAWATEYGGLYNNGSLVLTNIETKTSTVLYSFGPSQDSGCYPIAITFDSNSNTIYGVTYEGGVSNDGVLFSYNLQSSQYQLLYNFTSSVGAYAIVLSNNALYVSLNEYEDNGDNGYGSVGFYNLSTSSFTELYNFTEYGDDGYYPFGAFAVSSSGDVVYGTTLYGGSGDGTLFSLNVTSGSAELTVLFYYNSNAAFSEGGLVLDETNGLLYGTVSSPNGAVFAYDLNTNMMTFLYNFASEGGNEPLSGVVLSADKTTLYGITSQSGSNGGPAVFYALNSCYTAPTTTTASPTTTTAPPTTTTARPTTTPAPPTPAPPTTAPPTTAPPTTAATTATLTTTSGTPTKTAKPTSALSKKRGYNLIVDGVTFTAIVISCLISFIF